MENRVTGPGFFARPCEIFPPLPSVTHRIWVEGGRRSLWTRRSCIMQGTTEHRPTNERVSPRRPRVGHWLSLGMEPASLFAAGRGDVSDHGEAGAPGPARTDCRGHRR